MDMSKVIFRDETGHVYNISKNGSFGWIRNDRDNDDIFFHMNDVIDAPGERFNKGDWLKYDITFSPKGAKAINIRCL